MTDPNPLIEKFRVFVREHVLGREAWLDSSPEHPLAPIVELERQGISNWWVPAMYGGLGLSVRESLDIVELLAYGDAGLANGIAGRSLAAAAIRIYGDDAQKRNYLAPSATDPTFFGALSATEEAAGSELLRTATVARKLGNEYLLDGLKFVSTGAALAKFTVVLAKVAEGDLRAFIVPMDAKGVKVVKRWRTEGLRSYVYSQVALERCRIPASLMLRGQGVRLVEAATSAMRPQIAATAVGIGMRVRDVCLEYGAKKMLGGRPLAQNDVFAAKLGQMEAELTTMRAVAREAAVEFDEIVRGSDPEEHFRRHGGTKSAVVAKLICGQLGWKIASAGTEMFGGLGYMQEHIIWKLLRDVRHVAILEAGEDVIRALLHARHCVPIFE
ncbi:acyl-CoA dehydrogenase family protein [Pendulispora brunnea]|uniref:Acyl-CoA dehydrogenase family protein n=1 Tax=Pendulispora brunnea TaxID=2905690 RepID=A0ABZ2KRJ0_9BACT